MKAIVVRQPWATLIALGIKTIETRPGPPNGEMRPEGVRGLPGCSLERGERIAIVAAAAEPADGSKVDRWHTYRFAKRDHYLYNADETMQHALPVGAVACTVQVVGACPMEPCPPYRGGDGSDEDPPGNVIFLGGLDGGPWMFEDGYGPFPLMDQLPLGDFAPGRWGWPLADVRPCDPIPCKGKQGVFTLPDEIAAQLTEATR